ncbi:hypothetical protein [Actinoplanes sp. URMC 104]|uniref:hypothetical protein n=1 Tax=Actinoplanes sp. URMC 104 TaxID=3423409 RepID=UPI003F1D075C
MAELEQVLPSGFEVFDRAEARAVVDERMGARVRVSHGWLVLSRAAVALLESANGGRLLHGVVLGFDRRARRVGVGAAPVVCAHGVRQNLSWFQSGSEKKPVQLSAEWPAGFSAGDFFKLHELPSTLAPGGTPVELVDGVLVFEVPRPPVVSAPIGGVSRG